MGAHASRAQGDRGPKKVNAHISLSRPPRQQALFVSLSRSETRRETRRPETPANPAVSPEMTPETKPSAVSPSRLSPLLGEAGETEGRDETLEERLPWTMQTIIGIDPGTMTTTATCQWCGHPFTPREAGARRSNSAALTAGARSMGAGRRLSPRARRRAADRAVLREGFPATRALVGRGPAVDLRT